MPDDARPDVRLLGELFAHWAKEIPEREALSFQGRRLGWAELDERARRVTGALAAAGATGSRSSTRTHPPAWK
ncbi:hypothetical protein GCM10027598_67830 [Amycolatopsis oliviviridis]|uniref:Uncharacterized protein n=1 Tax=Amycolatopsis oliviviridis TaxID=1471590 RepID=A0ABQ3LZF7_9PSEU|nr:hypothetical protein [Amycolatopsis oliviviridis]GHH29932.1 hypothetical protein GCM10017790_62900 [Amycolatopsis oliviviridis]